MRICVQGLWHLGSVTAACLASLGHKVYGLDNESAVVQGLMRGIPPIFEPGLEDLTRGEIASGRLCFTEETAHAVKDAEVLWVAYDTPVDDDDNADVSYVITQIEKTLAYLVPGTTVLISSQLPVGTIRRLETIADTRFPEKDLGFVSAPENLRLGKSLEVFLDPDRVVIGVRSIRDRERVEQLLPKIAERIEWMSVESAEMTKHAINAFLATSVVFANEIASVCECVGADAKEVERGLKTESRIGPNAYVSPGSAFAGGTLARDIRFLNDLATDKRLVVPLLASVPRSNDEHKQWVKRKLNALFPSLAQIPIGVWGLTYKPGTDTLRRSMAVELVDWLAYSGAIVKVHDPGVRSIPVRWQGKVAHVHSELEAIEGARVLIIATGWPQYKTVTADSIATVAKGITIIDANRFLIQLANDMRMRYLAVGTPNTAEEER